MRTGVNARAETLRLHLYQAFQRRFIPWVIRRFYKKALPLLETPSHEGGSEMSEQRVKEVLWFHASSVGELEALWPVVESAAKSDPGPGLVITIFSPSALGALQKLKNKLQEDGAHLLYAGFCPIEGKWKESLRRFRPKVFVTSKYEAWPDLWAALSALGIPLMVLGAKDRRSFFWVRQILLAMGMSLPELHFVVHHQEDSGPLIQRFPEARVWKAPDPRWDRVVSRCLQAHPRVEQIVKGMGSAQKPWGVLGSVWPEDLEQFQETKTLPGGVFVVPHEVSEESIQKIEKKLSQLGWAWMRTSQMNSQNGDLDGVQAFLVDEMGFLSELYQVADWAYVGGGFGKGIHSTIEPAIHGIPIAVGPHRVEAFPETRFLKDSSQLSVLENPKHVSEWVEALQSQLKRREDWKKSVQDQLGGTDAVLQAVDRIGTSC